MLKVCVATRNALNTGVFCWRIFNIKISGQPSMTLFWIAISSQKAVGKSENNDPSVLIEAVKSED